MRDEVITPEQLKEYMRQKIQEHRPEIMKDFEEIWASISRFVKDEAGVKAFLKVFTL